MKKIFYFEGGLGDVLIDTFRYDAYASLSSLDPHEEQQIIVLACHNPFSHELFTFHSHADSFDLRFAPQHLITANQKELFDANTRMEYICSCVNVPIEYVTKGNINSNQSVLPNYPKIQPIVPELGVKILLAFDSAVEWKATPIELIKLSVIPFIQQNPQITFYLLDRPYNKYPRGERNYKSINYNKINFPSNVIPISPTIPDTLNFLPYCDLLITCHSALAQVSTRIGVPTIVSYPDNFDDFKLPKFGKSYTSTFINSKVKLIPHSIYTPMVFENAVKDLLFRPF